MIEVVCGVIFNDKSEVLLTQRAHGPHAGKWEFPGGKIEPNEKPENSLLRELIEELGIVVDVQQKLCSNNVLVNNTPMMLHFYAASFLKGQIQLTVHSDFKWVSTSKVGSYDLLDGDRIMIDFLSKAR